MAKRDEIEDKDPWEYKLIDVFSGGINTLARSDNLEDAELIEAKNIFLKQKLVQIDTGYATFGALVRGEPRAAFQFFKTDSSSELLLITNSTFYVWNSSEWQYVSSGTDTTASVGESAGSTAIDVVSEVGFSASDYIGIILDNGTQHQTTVTSTSSGVINIADAIPTGRSVAIGAAVVKAVALTGTLDILTSITVYTPNNWLIFTNGVDKPKRYDGTTCEDIPGLPASGNTVCKAVGVYNNHVLLLSTTEGGVASPQRVRWSDTADPTNWSTGNAGYNDLVDSEDFVVTGAGLGPYFIIYKERSITRMEYVGSADKLFNFTSVITGEGAISGDSLIDLGDYHVFVGNANIYEYRGGFSYKPLGDKIYHKIFGTSGDLNPSARSRLFSFYVEELDEVWIVYPKGSATIPDTLLRYRQSDQTWWIRELTNPILGYGFYQRTAGKTWTDLTGTWTEQTWTWNSNLLLANSPTTLLCGNSPKQVYEYDYSAVDDNGSAIAYQLETKDFRHPHYKVRLNIVEMLIKGSGILLTYSTDEGVTWNSVGTIIDSVTLTRQRIWKQVVAEQIRFRITGSGGGFQLGWFGFEFTLESEW